MVYQVVINHNGHYGYAEYDEAAKAIKIVIPEDPEAVKTVEKYMAEPHTMDIPTEDIRVFTTVTLMPTESLESFKNCLSRLWVTTGILVEWSMPVELLQEL